MKKKRNKIRYCVISFVTDHNFFVAKLDIEQIVLFDYFGGFKFVNPEDYFKANANIVIKE